MSYFLLTPKRKTELKRNLKLFKKICSVCENELSTLALAVGHTLARLHVWSIKRNVVEGSEVSRSYEETQLPREESGRVTGENVPLSVEETGVELHRRRNRVFSDQLRRADASHPHENVFLASGPDENVPLSVEETGPQTTPEAAFIDQHVDQIIQRAWRVDSILVRLLGDRVICRESCNTIRAKKTTQEKMRALITGLRSASGDAGKRILFWILMEKEPLMMKDLGAMGGNLV